MLFRASWRRACRLARGLAPVTRPAGCGLRAGAGEGTMRPVAEQAAPGFGGLLRQLRADAGLTQEELAEAASISPRSVSDLERGINLTARKDTARLLADALGLAGPRRALFQAAARGHAAAAGVLAAHDPLLTRPGNLPAQLSAFIGREREVSEVRALVESARLVTLTGPAGAARPGWGCRWPPSCWMGPRTGSGWRSWPRSPTRMEWRRPSARRCGWPRSRAGRRWRRCWMPSRRRMC